jgi:hypothetical protein
VDLRKRVLAGGLGGIAATLVLSGMREALSRTGLVFETAPMQVVERMDEVGLLEGLSPGARRLLTVAAHFAYGIGTGTAFGFLRRERGGSREEAAVGAALGLLAWGVPSTMDSAHPEGFASRAGPRGFWRGVGPGVLDTGRAREA